MDTTTPQAQGTGLSRRQRFALWRGRAITAIAEYDGYLPFEFGMSRHDRARWDSARSMTDLGELVVAWLHGEIRQTPGHCGAPCTETIPLVGALTVANRAGFITDNSQRADSDEWAEWQADVWGFASDDVLAGLRGAIAGTPLVLTACRRPSRRHHEGTHPRGGWRDDGCPLPDVADFWAERCPGVATDIRQAWYVVITDPQPRRNDVLWPALERFAKGEGR